MYFLNFLHLDFVPNVQLFLNQRRGEAFADTQWTVDSTQLTAYRLLSTVYCLPVTGISIHPRMLRPYFIPFLHITHESMSNLYPIDSMQRGNP
ncbi:hypothetical protein HYR99_30975 [Candidatus Poribacteria bacterium]|nr:hypothetical protein [Candidatus Poribacteria bacterium]